MECIAEFPDSASGFVYDICDEAQKWFKEANCELKPIAYVVNAVASIIALAVTPIFILLGLTAAAILAISSLSANDERASKWYSENISNNLALTGTCLIALLALPVLMVYPLACKQD